MAMLNPVHNPFGIGNVKGRVAKKSVLPASSPRFIQANSKRTGEQAFERANKTVRKGVNETKEATKNMKDKATSAAFQVNRKATKIVKQGANEAESVKENMKIKANSTANQMNEKAKGMAEKAKQVWDSAVETAQKAKDSVLGKADESKEVIKEAKLKRNMDNKKC